MIAPSSETPAKADFQKFRRFVLTQFALWIVATFALAAFVDRSSLWYLPAVIMLIGLCPRPTLLRAAWGSFDEYVRAGAIASIVKVEPNKVTSAQIVQKWSAFTKVLLIAFLIGFAWIGYWMLSVRFEIVFLLLAIFCGLSAIYLIRHFNG